VTSLSKQPLAMLLCGLACLCLLLQQSTGLICEAVHNAHAPGHTHGHEAHPHDHESAPHPHAVLAVDSEKGGHSHHPSEDHFSEVGDEATRPHSAHVALALAPRRDRGMVFDLPASSQTCIEEHAPWTAFKRRSAPPRAPPIAS